MTPGDRELPENDGPTEVAGAIPAPVVAFAAKLVELRALAASLEVPRIVPGGSTDRLRCDVEALGDVPEFDTWLAWVAHWAERFSEYSDAGIVSLRMSHSRHPTCPRFHMDAVRMRLIATLLGPGTEWLHTTDVRRSVDGSIGQDPDPQVIQQVAPGSVGIFRGSSFGSAPGVVHRSPRNRVDRVVMTLDIAA